MTLSNREVSEVVALLDEIDEHTFNCPYDTTCCEQCDGLRTVLKGKLIVLRLALGE